MTNHGLPTQDTLVRFGNREQAAFFSTLRKRVDGYFKENKISRHADARMVSKTVILLLAYILPFVALLVFALPVWGQMIMWAIMGLAMAGNGMSVMHDANHGAYSSSSTWNRWIGYSVNLLGGTVHNWNLQHNVLHHTYTNIAGKDNDIEGAFSMRFDPHQEHKKFHKHQWYYAFAFYSILTLYWGLAKDFVQFAKYNKEGVNRQTTKEKRITLFKMILIKMAYFAIIIGLPIAVGGLSVGVVVVGFLVMEIISGLILSLVFQLAHVVEGPEFPLPKANGEMENSWAVHQLHTTANFSYGRKVINWYVGGLNHQIEHHLFPGICHVHYNAIAPIVKETAEEFGHPYYEHKTFMLALKSHVRMLKKFGVPPLDEIMG